jgi:uncharacterized membrane protein HdeD (DUF308 family)
MISDSMIDSRTATTDAPPATPVTPVTPVVSRPRNPLPWVLLVLGLITNVAFHSVLENVYVSSASGLLVLGCVAVLAGRARFARTGA